MSVIFTPSVGDPVTITPVPGSIKYGEGHDVKGGSTIPHNLAGKARNGSCQVVIDSATGPTLAVIFGLVSGAVSGSTDVSGTDIIATQHSYDALIDVSIAGDAVQVATINWKGTTQEES
jgi:hypothetical protein